MTSADRNRRGGNRAAFSTPAFLGGPLNTHPDILTLRWLGTANFEVTFGDNVLLLDCFYDRGPRKRPLGFTPEEVTRADQIFIGHPHMDHISDAAQVAGQTGPINAPAPLRDDTGSVRPENCTVGSMVRIAVAARAAIWVEAKVDIT